MKRAMLALVAGGLLALVGLQSSHSHKRKALEPCRICALSAQTLRNVDAAPALRLEARAWVPVAQKPSVRPTQPPLRKTSARSPPLPDFFLSV